MGRTLIPQDMQNNTAADQLGAVPWTQQVGKGLSAVSGSFGPNDSRWSQVEVYNWDADFPDLIWKILGYSSRATLGGDPTTGIARVLPKQCPQFPFMFATRIANVQPLGWDKTKTNPSTGAELAGPYVRFNKAALTILYQTLDYDMKPDDAISVGDATTGEQSRFVSRFPEVAGDNMSLQDGEMVWEATAPNAGNPAITRQGMKIPYTRLRWVWRQVPDVGLFSGNGSNAGGLPTNLINAIGTVNNGTFMGYGEGTLLFESAKLTPIVLPINPAFLNLADGQSPRAWDAELNLVHFKAPAGRLPMGYAFDGHNLAMNKNGIWYLLVRQSGGGATTDVNRLYPSSSYPNIFKMLVA